jgi:hypothetical protein
LHSRALLRNNAVVRQPQESGTHKGENVTRTHRLLIIFVLMVLAGCMSRVYKHQAPPDDALDLPAVAATASITGEVSVRSRMGEMVKGADSTIYLVPATAYSTEWFDHYVVKRDKVDGKDPRSFASARAALVDGEGHFEFQNIPAGAYYLISNVHLERRGLRIGRLTFRMRSIDTIAAYAAIDVAPEQKVEVLVTRPSV